MDQGVGRCEPQGSLHGACAGNEMRKQRVCKLSANRGAGNFDLRAGKLLQARSQADPAAAQDYSDVASADPDILDGKPTALLHETPMKAACDCALLKHRLLLPDFTPGVKKEGVLTPGRRTITMMTGTQESPHPIYFSGRDIMQGIKRVKATTFAALLAVVLLSVVFVSPVVGQDGKQIYGNRCALCHGSDGDGKGVIMQTDAFDAKFWKKSDDAAISKAIVEGKGRMPAIPLSPEETKAVVEYMKATFKK
jgi:cytochrome c5